MGSKKYIFILFFIIIIVGITMFLRSNVENNVIKKDKLKEYADQYFTSYNDIIINNYDKLNKLNFRRDNPNKIVGVISKIGGALLEYSYDSSEKKNEYSEINQRIEFYLWPQMSVVTQTQPNVSIAPAKEPYNLTSTINMNPFAFLLVYPKTTLIFPENVMPFNLSIGGIIRIDGTLIQKNRLILKGSNSEDSWSTVQAHIDAIDQILWDSKNQINQNQINSLILKYKLPYLIERINDRIQKNYYKNNDAQFVEDINELKDNNATQDFIVKLWNDYLSNKNIKEPNIWEKIQGLDWINGLIFTIIGSVISAIIIAILLKYKIISQ